MMVAMTSTAAASGFRARLASVKPEWLTPRRLRYINWALLVGVLLVSGTLSGSS